LRDQAIFIFLLSLTIDEDCRHGDPGDGRIAGQGRETAVHWVRGREK
jgi:hypothetical protein